MRPLQLNGHTRPITQVLVNSTGTLLFTAGKDGNLGVWDMQDGNLLGIRCYKILVKKSIYNC
jgi:WD40 repeat protein